MMLCEGPPLSARAAAALLDAVAVWRCDAKALDQASRAAPGERRAMATHLRSVRALRHLAVILSPGLGLDEFQRRMLAELIADNDDEGEERAA